MEKQEKKITNFPKGFFTSMKPCSVTCSKNSEENEKPFEWSNSVIEGKSRVKLVSLKMNKTIKF